MHLGRAVADARLRRPAGVRRRGVRLPCLPLHKGHREPGEGGRHAVARILGRLLGLLRRRDILRRRRRVGAVLLAAKGR